MVAYPARVEREGEGMVMLTLPDIPEFVLVARKRAEVLAPRAGPSLQYPRRLSPGSSPVPARLADKRRAVGHAQARLHGPGRLRVDLAAHAAPAAARRIAGFAAVAVVALALPAAAARRVGPGPAVAVADSGPRTAAPGGVGRIAVAFAASGSGRARPDRRWCRCRCRCSRCWGGRSRRDRSGSPSLSPVRPRPRPAGSALGPLSLSVACIAARRFAADRAPARRAAPRPRRPAPGTSGGLTGAAPALSRVSGC